MLIRNVALAIAGALGAARPQARIAGRVAQQFARSAAADLMARRGASIVFAGRGSRPKCTRCAIGSTTQLACADRFHRAGRSGRDGARGIAAQSGRRHSRRPGIETLIIIGANPAYDAPGDLALRRRHRRRCRSRAHLGLYRRRDRRALHLASAAVASARKLVRSSRLDGTASIVQPLIRPLYDSRTAHEVAGLTRRRGRAVGVRPCPRAAGATTPQWRERLRRLVAANAAGRRHRRQRSSQNQRRRRRHLPQLAAARRPRAAFSLALAPDPSVFDGSFANNAWLQECPKPFTKQVWGNALHVSEADAAQSGRRRRRRGAAYRRQADRRGAGAGAARTSGAHHFDARSAMAARSAGGIGNGVGFDVYRLRQRRCALGDRQRHDQPYRPQARSAAAPSISSSSMAKPGTCSRASRLADLAQRRCSA